MSNNNYPNREELSKIFEYVDGELWRKAFISVDNRKYSARFIVNKCNHWTGYCHVRFHNRTSSYHVIVWILANGDIPEGKMIDHIDGNRINNNINNLRLVTNRENCQNQTIHRNGHLVGACFDKNANKWRSRVVIDGVQKNLGLFDTELEAHNKYCEALKLLRGVCNG